jgi:hypothetical protein
MEEVIHSDYALRQFKSFSGTISAVANITPVTFRVQIEASGEVALDFDEIQISQETIYLLEHWEGSSSELGNFFLAGVADDGAKFNTESLTLNSLNHTQNSSCMKPVGTCSQAVIFQRLHQLAVKPTVRVHLKGFKSFRSLILKSEIGTTTMGGQRQMDDTDCLNGYIQVEALEENIDVVAWRERAEKLIEHVRIVMSVASATMLEAPITEFYAGEFLETKAWSTMPQVASAMPIIHFMNQQPIFEAAVESFLRPPVLVKNLEFAIEWFAMSASHTELRLMNAMTALENLVASNLGVADMAILPDEEFEILKRALEKEIKAVVCASPDIEQSIASAARAELYPRLSDINRRSILDKIDTLATRWAVPLNGLNQHSIKAAKAARDVIVHTGSYYENSKSSHVDLWEHVTCIREVFIRFFFTIIAYEGQYVSHFGGMHDATFPPAHAPHLNANVDPATE